MQPFSGIHYVLDSIDFKSCSSIEDIKKLLRFFMEVPDFKTTCWNSFFNDT